MATPNNAQRSANAQYGRGISRIQGRLNTEVARNFVQSRRGAALQAGGEIMIAASDELVPTRTGELLNSHYVRIEGDKLVLGYDADHAELQHERLDYAHPSGQAKFLEKGMRSSRARALAAIADMLRF